MLMKRVMTSVITSVLVGLVIFYFPDWIFCGLVMFFVGLGLLEFFDIVEKKGIFVYKFFGVIVGLLVPLMIYLQYGEGYESLETLFIVTACLFTFVLQFIRRENTSDHLTSIAVTLLPLFYISWFFSFFLKLRFMDDGHLYVVFLVLVTKVGDIAAFFIGRSFGRNSLIPRISPKKTVEGTVGGLAASLGTALLCGSFLPQLSLVHLSVLGVFIGVLGQVGDLAESLIKRDCEVKDSGTSLPGFGGVLDLIDSLLFTAPMFYFYLKILVIR